MNFVAEESINGLRFPWNAWPSNRLDVVRNIVPLGCFFTPIKDIEGLRTLSYAPVHCKCRAVLNPYCSLDFSARAWVCPMCKQRNALPQEYYGIHDDYLPTELHDESVAVEYSLPQTGREPPCFLLVVDLCVDKLDLEGLKSALHQLLHLLPSYCLVGLITFGSLVHVHRLETEMPIALVFPAETPPDKKKLAAILRTGVDKKSSGQHAGLNLGWGRYLVKAEDCEAELEAAINDLQAEEQSLAQNSRPLRATGAAVATAVALLELGLPQGGAHILLFTSGPATVGPGCIVGQDRSEALRSHHDFEKGELKHFSAALRHYDILADCMNKCGHTLDLFACALDQVGVAEMHPAIHYTGGSMMMAETFSHKSVSACLAEYFRTDRGDTLQFGASAKMTLLCSPEVKIQGASGPCCSLQEGGPSISDTVKMAGGTNAWRLSSLTPSTTVCMFLDVAPKGRRQIEDGQLLHLQFLTEYQHPSGQRRLRVVTTARQWAEANPERVAQGFDQEAGLAMMARWMNFKLMSEETSEVAAWLDNCLVKLAARFGGFTRNQPDTFEFPGTFSMLPQWFFNLRRSPFMQVFGNSPDETAYHRHMMDKENVTNCLIMIQPQLEAFSMQQPRKAVPLDVQSIAPDEILVLDTYFMVVIHYGSTVAQWRKAGYSERPEHEAFRQFLSAPLKVTALLSRDRYPVPKLLETDQGGSQARYLLAKLNPSQSHIRSTNVEDARGGQMIVTDDVPFEDFLNHLQKLAVNTD